MSSERAKRAQERLKQLRLMQRPSVAEPERPAVVLTAGGNELERLLGELLYRVERLEKQNVLLFKVLWRSSATIIGMVAAGPIKDWAEAVLRGLGVGG